MSFDDGDIWTSSDTDAPSPAAPARRSGPRRPGRGPAGPARPPRRPAPEPVAAHPDDEHDWVELPGESRVPRWLAALLVVGALVGVTVGGGWWWYHQQVDPSGDPGAAVTVQIPEGASTSRVGDLLDEAGVISNAMVFNFYVGGKDLTAVQAGTYVFRSNSSFDDAIAVLDAGPKAPVTEAVTKVTIPEGYTVAQMIERISTKVPRLKAADLQAALDQGKVPSSLKPEGTTSYEGLLFPATYEITEDDNAVDVLTEMAQEMEQRVDAIGLDAAQAHIRDQWGLELSGYDLLKVASMIQYEAAVPADAPKIGAVTYNRLEKGMPLQYDSTSIYEGALTGKTPEQIDYKADSPYNTRTRPGLPPTPISSPGEYALEGAMDPADGPWLYFVLTDAKVVSFTDSYDEFLGFKALCKQRGLGCG